jgi:hypothetical protein
MRFLKRLTGLLSRSARSSAGHFYTLHVQCHRCGEIIHAQVNLSNDLSVEYGEADGATTYHCRKLVMGNQNCFQQIEVKLTFDANRKVTDRQITGGTFVEA